jgi:hypothetical protein
MFDLCMQKHTSVSFLMGARCYKVGIYSFVADTIFFLSNDVNDEMLMSTLVNLWKMALFVQPFCKKVYSQRLQLTT